MPTDQRYPWLPFGQTLGRSWSILSNKRHQGRLDWVSNNAYFSKFDIPDIQGQISSFSLSLYAEMMVCFSKSKICECRKGGIKKMRYYGMRLLWFLPSLPVCGYEQPKVDMPFWTFREEASCHFWCTWSVPFRVPTRGHKGQITMRYIIAMNYLILFDSEWYMKHDGSFHSIA